MKIAPLREQLVFQEKRLKQDDIGNESASYDKKVLVLNSLTTRIFFRGQFYAIESIDGDTVPRSLIYIVTTKEELYD